MAIVGVAGTSETGSVDPLPELAEIAAEMECSFHVDAAWGFASYMASEEGNKVYATETGRIPNTSALVSDFWVPVVKERFGVENAQNFVEAFKRSEVDVVGGISRSQFWAEAVKPVGYDPILANDATAAEVMPAVDTAVQAILDDFWS